MTKAKTSMQATSLRTIMLVVVFVAVLLTMGGFYLTQDWLRAYAKQANQAASGISVTNGDNNTQALTGLRDKIAANQASGDKADAMIASSQNYQNQIIKDINKYAADAGITVTGHNFTQSDTNGANILTLINGLTPKFVTITIGNPVSLKSLLQFFEAIESNLPKMQIMGINLTPAPGSGDLITTDPITIGVYTK